MTKMTKQELQDEIVNLKTELDREHFINNQYSNTNLNLIKEITHLRQVIVILSVALGVNSILNIISVVRRK